jgi:CheY-like chemotaxis protein/two-component sensor histidine kinase
MIEELVLPKEKAIESDKLKSAFLANMSHEIRTPMNAILGFSELLTKNISNPGSLEKFAHIIHSRSVYLLALIDDILNLSQVEAGIIRINPVKFSVNKLLDDLKQQVNLKLNSLNKNLDIILGKTRSDEDSTIYFDKTRLQQILNHLLENATKFTGKGSITISYAEGQNNNIIFTVADTGKGIPTKSQKLLFERFHKSEDSSFNYGGLGLGLSICKGILDVLGGKIWAESEENKGTKISFSIPATFIESNNTISTQTKAEKKPHVLIVEDDLYNIELYHNFLSEFNLIITEDGFSALNIFTQNQDIGVVLMDIGLADLNGIEVTKKIREFNTTIPIIAVTAYAGESDKELCLNAGCNEFFSKPVNFNHLIDKIKKYIES